MWKMPQSYSCNCKCSSALGRILRFGPKQKQKKHKKKENKAARTWPALKAPGPAYITIPNFGQKFSFGLCLCFIIWFWAKEARFQLLIGIRTALLPLTMKFIQSFYLAAELREPKQKDKYTKLTRTQVKMSR